MRISVILLIAGGLAALLLLSPSTPSTVDVAPGTMVLPHQGDLSTRGGSPTVREPFTAKPDDPATTNDESNDQPVGYFGTKTLSVCNLQAGNCYTLDGELDGLTLERVYFPKGGWVDFPDCELDEELEGTCGDERGRAWSFNGEA